MLRRLHRFRVMSLDHCRHDVRCALRSIARSPIACAVAVISLAAGIGATTATLTLRNAIFNNPPPLYRDPGQLSRIELSHARAAAGGCPGLALFPLDCRRRSRRPQRRGNLAARRRAAQKRRRGDRPGPFDRPGILCAPRRQPRTRPIVLTNSPCGRQHRGRAESPHLAEPPRGPERRRRPRGLDRRAAAHGCRRAAAALLVQDDGLGDLGVRESAGDCAGRRGRRRGASRVRYFRGRAGRTPAARRARVPQTAPRRTARYPRASDARRRHRAWRPGGGGHSMAGGDGRSAHAPHRVRQRRHPYVRAMDQPRTGDRDPGVARRRPRAHHGPAADRVSGAGHGRRDTRRFGDVVDAGALPAECSRFAGFRSVDRWWHLAAVRLHHRPCRDSVGAHAGAVRDTATPDQSASTAAPVRSGPATDAARARRHGNLRHGRADGRDGGTGRRLAPDVDRRHGLPYRAASDGSCRESGGCGDFNGARSRQACPRRGERRRIDRRSHGHRWWP